jgi:hypothetical protein
MLAIDLNPIDWVKGAVTGAANEVVEFAFGFLGSWIEDGLSWIAEKVGGQFAAAGKVDWGSQFIFGEGGVYANVGGLALAIFVGSIFIQAMSLSWRRDAGIADVTDMVRDIPVTIVALAVITTFAAAILAACDALAEHFTSDVVAIAFTSSFKLDAGVPGLFRVLVGLLMSLALLLLYIEQLARSQLLTLVIVMSQLAVAARVWPRARYLLEAVVKIFLALAVMPILAGVLLSISFSGWDAAGSLDFTRALAAMAGIFMSVLVPFFAFKAFPISADAPAGAGAAMAGMAVGAAWGASSLALGGGAGAAAGAATGAAAGAATGGSTGAAAGGLSGVGGGAMAGAASAGGGAVGQLASSHLQASGSAMAGGGSSPASGSGSTSGSSSGNGAGSTPSAPASAGVTAATSGHAAPPPSTGTGQSAQTAPPPVASSAPSSGGSSNPGGSEGTGGSNGGQDVEGRRLGALADSQEEQA